MGGYISRSLAQALACLHCERTPLFNPVLGWQSDRSTDSSQPWGNSCIHNSSVENWDPHLFPKCRANSNLSVLEEVRIQSTPTLTRLSDPAKYLPHIPHVSDQLLSIQGGMRSQLLCLCKSLNWSVYLMASGK